MLKSIFAAALTLAIASPALAQADGAISPPPAGAILDLAGTPIPDGGFEGYQQYTVNFTATLHSTAITFAFVDVFSQLYLSDPSVTDLTTPNGNLLRNANFGGGVHTSNGNPSTPVFWTYDNQWGGTQNSLRGYPGSTERNCGVGPRVYCWIDGLSFDDDGFSHYSGLTQRIATTPGHAYQISFWIAESGGCSYSDDGPPCYFSQQWYDTTIGTGTDVLVYAGGDAPSTLSCLITGTVNGPPRQLQVSMQDILTGLNTIQLTSEVNASVKISSFAAATTSPVIVTATKLNQSQSSDVAFTVTNEAGASVSCDPVDYTATVENRPESHTFRKLSSAEHYIRIVNGTPGLRRAIFRVNGKESFEMNLAGNGVHIVDIGSAMYPGSGDNLVVMEAFGRPGASATILIGDSSVE